jgi:hypothetical protein
MYQQYPMYNANPQPAPRPAPRPVAVAPEPPRDLPPPRTFAKEQPPGFAPVPVPSPDALGIAPGGPPAVAIPAPGDVGVEVK